MSDLVERALLKIADDGYAIGCCTITDREARELARDIALEIAIMQTDAAPALKPAVEVWREASDAATDGSVKYQSHADQAAAAVIEADRAAIIAAKDAEIAALQAHADALAEGARFAKEIIADSWGEAAMERGDCQAYNVLHRYIRAYEEFRR